jgi:hypothetical protein
MMMKSRSLKMMMRSKARRTLKEMESSIVAMWKWSRARKTRPLMRMVRLREMMKTCLHPREAISPPTHLPHHNSSSLAPLKLSPTWMKKKTREKTRIKL